MTTPAPSTTSPSADTLQINEFPIALWLVGDGMLVFGLLFMFAVQQALFGFIFVIAGVVLSFLLAQMVFITANRVSDQIKIRYVSLLRRSEKKFALWEIDHSELEYSRGDSGATYRVVLVLKTGERVPLHGYYSSGSSSKQRTVDKINNFLGVQAPESAPNSIGNIMGYIQKSFEQTGSGETGGIRWTLEESYSQEQADSPAYLRWSTSDFHFPGGFFFLMQKPKGMKDSTGILSGLATPFYRRMIFFYGFTEADLPGLETAKFVPIPDPALADFFTAFTSLPEQANRLITAWVTTLLVEWASKYPLKAIQIGGSGQPGQLAVLFSPDRLALVIFGPKSREPQDDLIHLGAGLAKEARL